MSQNGSNPRLPANSKDFVWLLFDLNTHNTFKWDFHNSKILSQENIWVNKILGLQKGNFFFMKKYETTNREKLLSGKLSHDCDSCLLSKMGPQILILSTETIYIQIWISKNFINIDI